MAKKALETNLSQQGLEQQWKNVQDFQRTARTKDKPLGWMDKQDWEETQVPLREVGFLTEIRPVETYYTNEYLPAG